MLLDSISIGQFPYQNDLSDRGYFFDAKKKKWLPLSMTQTFLDQVQNLKKKKKKSSSPYCTALCKRWSCRNCRCVKNGYQCSDQCGCNPAKCTNRSFECAEVPEGKSNEVYEPTEQELWDEFMNLATSLELNLDESEMRELLDMSEESSERNIDQPFLCECGNLMIAEDMKQMGFLCNNCGEDLF